MSEQALRLQQAMPLSTRSRHVAIGRLQKKREAILKMASRS